jgi:hypothetical protein
MRANSPAVRRIPMNQEKAVNAIVKLNQKGGGYIEEKDFDRIMRRYCPVSATKPNTVKQINAALEAADVQLAILYEVQKRLGIPASPQASVSPADRCVAVSALAECLQSKRSLEEWDAAANVVVSRYLPQLFDNPKDEHALSELSFLIFSAALAIEGLRGKNEPMPDLTPEQREFYVDLRFRYDAETGKLWISDGLGRPVNTTIQ